MFGQFACLLGEIGRGADIAREIAQITSQADAMGQRETLREPPRSPLFVALGDGQNDPAQCGSVFCRHTFHLLKTVSGFACGACGLHDAPFDVAMADRQFSDMEFGINGAGSC